MLSSPGESTTKATSTTKLHTATSASMNATKRKFNALLNGIGNKSSTSLSSTNDTGNNIASSSETELQKRRRIVESPSNSRNTPRSKITPTTRSSAAIHHKKSASLATAALNPETPKYAPWDRVEFLKRLKSFSNLTDWTPKPARVNEVEWAKRGWVCQKFESVRCCLCNVEILVKLNRKTVNGKEEPVYVEENIEDALVDKYVELIVTSHDENCLWRKRGCDESIFKLPLNNASNTITNLRERYDELCTRKDTLPYMFNMRTPPDFDLDVTLGYLTKDFFTSSQGNNITEAAPSGEINRVAFIMALFGWQGHTHDRLGPQVGSVSCQACFRVLGLWLFKSKQVNDAGEEVVGAAVSCLDTVEEHREYCPWRNPASQNGQKQTTNSSGASLAGWEVISRVLKNDYYLRTSGERQSAKLSTPRTPRQEEAEPLDDGILADDGDAESIREENDKKRWARLRRVKSLFDPKGAKKLPRTDTGQGK